MLLADKRALETNLKVSLLSIREKELNFYTNNCLAIGTQSALLAGFAYAALQTKVRKGPLAFDVFSWDVECSSGDVENAEEGEDLCRDHFTIAPLHLIYLVCSLASLGFQLLSVV